MGINDEIKRPDIQPEIKDSITPLVFLQQVRNKLLGDNPSQETVEVFNNSLQGRALRILEKHYKIIEQRERDPLIKILRYDLKSRTYDLYNKEQSRIGIEEPMNLTIFVDENGLFTIDPIHEEDELFPNSVKNVVIDGVSGVLTPNINNQQIRRLELIMESLDSHCEGLTATVPLARQYRENYGYVPMTLSPRIGWEGIRALRGSNVPENRL